MAVSNVYSNKYSAEKAKEPVLMTGNVVYGGLDKDKETGAPRVRAAGEANIASYSIGIVPNAVVEKEGIKVFYNSYGIGRDKDEKEVRANQSKYVDVDKNGKNGPYKTSAMEGETVFVRVNFFVNDQKDLEAKAKELDAAVKILREYEGGKLGVNMFVDSFKTEKATYYDVLSIDVTSRDEKPEQKERLEKLNGLLKSARVLKPEVKFHDMQKLMEEKKAILFSPEILKIPLPDGTVKETPVAEAGNRIEFKAPERKAKEFGPVAVQDDMPPEPEAFEPEQNAVGEDMDIPF